MVLKAFGSFKRLLRNQLEMMAELEALKAQISGGAASDQKSGDKDSRDEEDSYDGEEKEDNE